STQLSAAHPSAHGCSRTGWPFGMSFLPMSFGPANSLRVWLYRPANLRRHPSFHSCSNRSSRGDRYPCARLQIVVPGNSVPLLPEHLLKVRVRRFVALRSPVVGAARFVDQVFFISFLPGFNRVI